MARAAFLQTFEVPSNTLNVTLDNPLPVPRRVAEVAVVQGRM